MKKVSSNNKKTDKDYNTSHKFVTIDVTDLYDDLKAIADEDVRTIEEQCKYFIKHGMKNSCRLCDISSTTFNDRFSISPKWEPEPVYCGKASSVIDESTVLYSKSIADSK